MVALIPILVLFAGAALVDLRGFARERTGPQRAACLAVAVGVAILCNWPLFERDYMRSVTQYNLGNELAAAGNTDEAMARYRKAIALHPENAMANHNLGALLAGIIADAVSIQAAIWAVAALTAASGFVVIVRMYETLPNHRA